MHPNRLILGSDYIGVKKQPLFGDSAVCGSSNPMDGSRVSRPCVRFWATKAACNSGGLRRGVYSLILMPNGAEVLGIVMSIAIVIAVIACSTATLVFMQRFWSAANRIAHNDMIGWQISVTGTTYAVVVGFMLYAVWNNFQVADANAMAEANSIVNVVRSAQGLPPAAQVKVRMLATRYLDSILKEEWVAMEEDREATTPSGLIEELWRAVPSTPVVSPAEQVSLGQTLTELSAMTEHRRLRHLQAHSGIPTVLWFVLIAGGVVVILSACMFGSLNFRVQLTQVLLLALMLSLVVLAIADLSSPFRGAVRISPLAFQQARATLRSSGLDRY